jgi:GNAT superfamily N-acetyltransferase
VSLNFAVLGGDDFAAGLDAVARLRISVFRDYPYLYDGTLGYERCYLSRFAASPGATIVAALDGSEIVGAATGCPLVSEHEEFVTPFRDFGLDPGHIFYCAESVLLPAYRGQGAGHRFFELREEKARSLGLTQSAFCAVIRPDNHPARPTGYQALDEFWRKRGYAPVAGLVTRFSWTDIGDAAETEKLLQVWMRDL